MKIVMLCWVKVVYSSAVRVMRTFQPISANEIPFFKLIVHFFRDTGKLNGKYNLMYVVNKRRKCN